jgi:hypothetical protein
MALMLLQLYAIQATERTASVLSLLGAAFIISTFFMNKEFHKLINQLIFYACFGNVMANIGNTHLHVRCYFRFGGAAVPVQGFLIQMYDPKVRAPLTNIVNFLPADVLWTLTMH